MSRISMRGTFSSTCFLGSEYQQVPFFSLIYIVSSLAAEQQKQITLRSKPVYKMNMTHVDIQTYIMLLSEKNTLRSKPA
jgi:hypothetical protein